MLHQIGVGVLGPVFRTYQPVEDRLVAVKVFRLDITPERASALATELDRLVAVELSAATVARPLAAGVEGMSAFLAQEYVAAESLDVAMRHYAPANLTAALPLIGAMADAVSSAHAVGIRHGGLHPRDVFVTPEVARVAGFGIVAALEAIDYPPPTRRPYTAPERVARREWGAPADVFSLAAIAYELLTARRLAGTGADAAETLTDIAGASPDALRPLFAAALSVEPSERPSPAAFAAGLAAAADETLPDRPSPASGAAAERIEAAASPPRRRSSRSRRQSASDRLSGSAEEAVEVPVAEPSADPSARPTGRRKKRARRQAKVKRAPREPVGPGAEIARAGPESVDPEPHGAEEPPKQVGEVEPTPTPSAPVVDAGQSADEGFVADAPVAVGRDDGPTPGPPARTPASEAEPADAIAWAADAELDTLAELERAVDPDSTASGDDRPSRPGGEQVASPLDYHESVWIPEHLEDDAEKPSAEPVARRDAEAAPHPFSDAPVTPQAETTGVSPDGGSALIGDQLDQEQVHRDAPEGPLADIGAARPALGADTTQGDREGGAEEDGPEADVLGELSYDEAATDSVAMAPEPSGPAGNAGPEAGVAADDTLPELVGLASRPDVAERPEVSDAWPGESPPGGTSVDASVEAPERPSPVAGAPSWRATWVGLRLPTRQVPVVPALASVALGMVASFVVGYGLGSRSVAPEPLLMGSGAATTRSEAGESASGPQADEPAEGASAPPPAGPVDDLPVLEVSEPEIRLPAAESPEPAQAPAEPAPDEPRPAATTDGRILVRSSPAGAQVVVNGLARGLTPLALRDLGHGSYSIRVSRAGFEPQLEVVELSADQPSASLLVELAESSAPPTSPPLEEPRGSLLVDSRPRGADVVVDGELVGATPTTVADLTVGSHEVEIVLDGYRPWATRVEVTEGDQGRVAASLERAP